MVGIYINTIKPNIYLSFDFQHVFSSYKFTKVNKELFIDSFPSLCVMFSIKDEKIGPSFTKF